MSKFSLTQVNVSKEKTNVNNRKMIKILSLSSRVKCRKFILDRRSRSVYDTVEFKQRNDDNNEGKMEKFFQKKK